MAYFKLLFRYAPQETKGKYFNAVCPEEIPQRRQHTTTRLDWTVNRRINIKKIILSIGSKILFPFSVTEIQQYLYFLNFQKKTEVTELNLLNLTFVSQFHIY